MFKFHEFGFFFFKLSLLYKENIGFSNADTKDVFLILKFLLVKDSIYLVSKEHLLIN